MNLDFTKTCRLCLRYCKDYIDLSQNNGARSLSPELMKTINYCYGLQIDVTDNLPTKVCLQCVQVLLLFYTTKNNVMASEQLLKSILSIRNNYESNKVEPFLKPQSDSSFGLLESEDKETKNTSDNEKMTELVNKTLRDSINLKYSNFVNGFKDSSQLNESSNLVYCHGKSSEDLNPITTTNIKAEEDEGIEEPHLKGVDGIQITETLSGERNIDFLSKPTNIYKLSQSADAVNVEPESDQGDKMIKTGEPKVKKLRRLIPTRRFKEIGTVIDETNILQYCRKSKLRF